MFFFFFFSSRRRHTRCALVTGVQTCALPISSWGYNGTAFTNIVGRMATMMPEIQAANVAIDYENVGLGYAGDPNAPDVAPLVRVRLTGLSFTPTLFTLFGASVSLPDFSAEIGRAHV